jgi:predicted RNase H-like HicB family nuclease
VAAVSAARCNPAKADQLRKGAWLQRSFTLSTTPADHGSRFTDHSSLRWLLHSHSLIACSTAFTVPLCLVKLKRMKQFTLEYWTDDGWYVGRLKEMPAVMSQGETLEELQAMIRDAYRLITEDAAENTFVPRERHEMAISL